MNTVKMEFEAVKYHELRQMLLSPYKWRLIITLALLAAIIIAIAMSS